MQVEIIDNYPDFMKISELWDKTLEASNFNHIFLTHDWLSSWWEDFGAGNNLFVILIWDKDVLLAAAPLMIRNIRIGKLIIAKKLQFIAHEISDYMDFIIAGQYEPCFRLLMGAIMAKANEWDWAELIYVSESSPNFRYWKEKCRSKNVTCSVVQRDASFVFNYFDNLGNRQEPVSLLPATIHGVGSGLLKRHSKLLNRVKELKLVQINSYLEFEAALDYFVEYHNFKLKKKGEMSHFETEAGKRYLLDLAKKLAAKGRLESIALKTKEKFIAMIIGFKYNRTFYYYLPAYNPEYKKFSPGNIIIYLLLQAYCENKAIDRFDFLRGNERYKHNWANHKINLFSVQLFASRIKYLLYFAIKAQAFLFKRINLNINRITGSIVGGKQVLCKLKNSRSKQIGAGQDVKY